MGGRFNFAFTSATFASLATRAYNRAVGNSGKIIRSGSPSKRMSSIRVCHLKHVDGLRHRTVRLPWLEPVIISRRLGEELEAEVARFLELAREGAVLIGGFISPGERRVAREAAAISRSRLIYLHPWGLSRYKPHGHAAAERLASGLTLALSGFPDTEEAVPRRENCLCNNRWAQAIALTSCMSPAQTETRAVYNPLRQALAWRATDVHVRPDNAPNS